MSAVVTVVSGVFGDEFGAVAGFLETNYFMDYNVGRECLKEKFMGRCKKTDVASKWVMMLLIKVLEVSKSTLLMCVYMHVFMYVCMYVWMYLYVFFVCIFLYIN